MGGLEQRAAEGGLRRQESEPGEDGRGGRQPAARLERVAAADRHLRGDRRRNRSGHHPQPGPDGERPERARGGRAPEFIQKDPPAKYLAPAYGLLGTALENAKRPAEAAEAFRNASKSADLEYLKARYLIDAGRAFVAGGKQTDAVAVYRSVIDSFPESPSVTEAKVRLAELTDGKM